MDARVPSHVEVSGLIRSVSAEGGFATVLRKGDRDSGSILVVLTENGTNPRLFERLPSLEGARKWSLTLTQDPENKADFKDYLTRRGDRDPDLWIVELDIAQGERFIGNPSESA